MKDKLDKEYKLKMTWKSVIHSCIMDIEMGDEKSRAYAKRELMKLADKLDKWNEENDIPNGYLKPQRS